MQKERLDQLFDFLTDRPNDPFIKYAIAMEYMKHNDLEKAQIYFEQLIEHHPDYVGTYYHLGRLFEQTDEQAKAINTYEKGMIAAKKAGDMHAAEELQHAFDTLQSELDIDID